MIHDLSPDARIMLDDLQLERGIEAGPYVPFLFLKPRAKDALAELLTHRLVTCRPHEKPRVHVWKLTDDGRALRDTLKADRPRDRMVYKSHHCDLTILDMAGATA